MDCPLLFTYYYVFFLSIYQLKLDGRIRPNKLLCASQLINLQNDHTALAQQSFHPWFNDHNSSKITHWYLINFLKNYTSQRNEPILSAIMRKNSNTFFWSPCYNFLTKGANQYLVKSVLCTVWKKHGHKREAKIKAHMNYEYWWKLCTVQWIIIIQLLNLYNNAVYVVCNAVYTCVHLYHCSPIRSR